MTRLEALLTFWPCFICISMKKYIIASWIWKNWKKRFKKSLSPIFLLLVLDFVSISSDVLVSFLMLRDKLFCRNSSEDFTGCCKHIRISCSFVPWIFLWAVLTNHGIPLMVQIQKEEERWTQVSSRVDELSATCDRLETNNTQLTAQLFSLKKTLVNDYPSSFNSSISE